MPGIVDRAGVKGVCVYWFLNCFCLLWFSVGG